ncbi:MAG: GNAT family N-acetyltransferase [Eubacteriales bacterium]|nr:GNAT family N-acetyltransferase [Eubacteriales bacterium]
MIEQMREQEFDEVFHLMQSSFPYDECRSYEEEKELLRREEFCIYVCRGEDEIKAFITVWAFDDFVYVDHFAVNPKYRNEGLGTSMLDEIQKKYQRPLCLEVEPPEGALAERRIGFYERNGFCFNEYPYMQPPIAKNRQPIPLFVMSSGKPLDRRTFEKVRDTLYQKVYGV